MKQVKILIAPTGEVTIEALGFKGPACEKATAEAAKILGKSTTTKKPEYYQAATVGQSQSLPS